ncbi:MAG: hypothetical protein ACP5T3_02485 [Candidatus Micrarchaeia archaeon]
MAVAAAAGFAVSANGIVLVAVIFASFGFACALSVLLSRARQTYAKHRFVQQMLLALEKVDYYLQKGFSLAVAVNVVAANESGEVKQQLIRFKNSVVLGMPIDKAIAQLGIEVSGDNIAMAVASLKTHDERHASETEGSIQTYATLNMFISTIAPSFVIFAFVGTAVIAGAFSNMLLLSVLLLFAVPLAYAFGNLLMSRRLYA